jgi:peptide/nickel transport system ATP-binding protein
VTRVRGTSTSIRTRLAESPPHPDPLPASGAREKRSDDCGYAFRTIFNLSRMLPKIPFGRKMMNITNSTP